MSTKKCEPCDGTGASECSECGTEKECDECNGTGEVVDDE